MLSNHQVKRSFSAFLVLWHIACSTDYGNIATIL